MEYDAVIKTLAVALTFIGLYKAVVEYQKAQAWKKAEFLAKEMKEFFAEQYVKRVLLILDWNAIKLKLEEGELAGKSELTYTDELWNPALELQTTKHSFTYDEALIRRSMDEFLTKIGNFQNYIDSGLISHTDLKPYLEYWIKIMCDPTVSRKTDDMLKVLWRFITFYEHEQVIKLAAHFGYRIRQ